MASVVMTLAAPAALAYPPSGGGLTLASYAVQLGGTDTAHGTGFDANEGVNGFIHSARVFIGHTTSNGNGVANLTFTVPTTLAAGHHTVELVGQRSGVAESVGLTVVAGAGSSASSGSGLPFTGGNDILPMTAAGVGLVLVGGLALVAARRRRSHPGLPA
jgi:LPXTG-motif cell wall-anchored protein